MDLSEFKTAIDNLVAQMSSTYPMSDIKAVLQPAPVPIDRGKFFWGAFKHALNMKKRAVNEGGICMYHPPGGEVGCLISPFIKDYSTELEGCDIPYANVQIAIGLDPLTLSDEDIDFLVRLQGCHDMSRDMDQCRQALFEFGQKHGFIPKVEV